MSGGLFATKKKTQNKVFGRFVGIPLYSEMEAIAMIVESVGAETLECLFSIASKLSHLLFRSDSSLVKEPNTSNPDSFTVSSRSSGGQNFLNRR